MSRPMLKRFTELPVQSWSDWDDVRLVKAAIRSLELGVFDTPSLIVEAMGRDDRISGCLETRTRALPALPLLMEPRGDKRQARAVSNELEERFEEFYSDAALTELIQWGILLGVGVAENVWVYEESRWWPTLKVWHPRHLSYRQDTNTYWMQTKEGSVEVVAGDGTWVLYTPYGDARGWMHGKARSLYIPWLMRSWCLRDWARYNEVHGMPIKKIVTPPGAQQDDKDKFMNEVAGIGSEATIRTPRVLGGGGAGDTDRYDIELLEATSMNWQTFDKQLEKADTNIAITLLGQNLTTEVKGGSYAAAAAHMQIRNDVLQFDSESLGQCLRKQSVAWWALHNFGSAELAPMPKWKTKSKSPEEKTAIGTAFDNLGKGILSLKNAGIKVDVDKVMEQEEVPVTGPAGDPPEQPFGQAPKIPAGPGGEKPEGGPRPGQPALARPPVRAAVPPAMPTDHLEAERVAREWKAAHPGGFSVLAADQGHAAVPPAAVEGQSYVDRLVENGTASLSAAFSVNLSAVMRAVYEAKDFASMRRTLLDLYPQMTAEDEADLLHHGMVMAELAGRYAVRTEMGLPVKPQGTEE